MDLMMMMSSTKSVANVWREMKLLASSPNNQEELLKRIDELGHIGTGRAVTKLASLLSRDGLADLGIDLYYFATGDSISEDWHGFDERVIGALGKVSSPRVEKAIMKYIRENKWEWAQYSDLYFDMTSERAYCLALELAAERRFRHLLPIVESIMEEIRMRASPSTGRPKLGVVATELYAKLRGPDAIHTLVEWIVWVHPRAMDSFYTDYFIIDTIKSFGTVAIPILENYVIEDYGEGYKLNSEVIQILEDLGGSPCDNLHQAFNKSGYHDIVSFLDSALVYMQKSCPKRAKLELLRIAYRYSLENGPDSMHKLLKIVGGLDVETINTALTHDNESYVAGACEYLFIYPWVIREHEQLRSYTDKLDYVFIQPGAEFLHGSTLMILLSIMKTKPWISSASAAAAVSRNSSVRPDLREWAALVSER